MVRSGYIADLRAHVGSRLLVVAAVTAVIVDDRGRFLLARHGDGGKWGFVGGAVEPLETPREAAVREVWEELGVGVDVGGVIDTFGGSDLVHEYANGDRVAYVTTAYRCVLEAPPAVKDVDEISEVAWFDVESVVGLDRFGWVDQVVESYLSSTVSSD